MPMREFGCTNCGRVQEIYHPSIDPTTVPAPECCNALAKIIWSVPNIDTADTFHPFDYTGPDGRAWRVDNLHKLRAVEHAYLETGHNIRFDAYSAEPSNPDAVDGAGLEYWNGDKNSTTGKAFGLPLM